MSSNPPADLSPATREKWLKLVEAVRSPEAEPSWRRRNQRYAVDATQVNVLFSPPDGHGPVVLPASLLEVSADGMMIRTHKAIPNETELALRMMFFGLDGLELIVLGHVVHCTETVGGYKIGIALDFPG